MRYMWLATFGLALGLWLPPAGAAAETTAAWGSLAPLATGRPMVAPAGWLNYCMAALKHCLQSSEAKMIEPTPAMLALVERVQRDVNARIQPRAEPAGLDRWQAAVTSGDCEDYALAKQTELRAAGVPAGAARLVTARLGSGEMHAVLAVETSRGTLILDNLHPGPVPVHDLDYPWLGEEAPSGQLRWLELRRPGPGSGAASRYGATETYRMTELAQ